MFSSSIQSFSESGDMGASKSRLGDEDLFDLRLGDETGVVVSVCMSDVQFRAYSKAEYTKSFGVSILGKVRSGVV